MTGDFEIVDAITEAIGLAESQRHFSRTHADVDCAVAVHCVTRFLAWCADVGDGLWEVALADMHAALSATFKGEPQGPARVIAVPIETYDDARDKERRKALSRGVPFTGSF